MACYKKGGCGSFEMYSCSECPASKPEYLNKNKTTVKELVNEEKIPFPAQHLTRFFLGEVSYNEAVDCTVEEINKLIDEAIRGGI